MIKEIYKERKSKLEMFVIDISDITSNHSKDIYLPFDCKVGVKFDFYKNDILTKKEIVKITYNEWLDLEFIFIKSV